MKKPDLTFKVLNTEEMRTGEVKLRLRCNQPVTPAMRRAMRPARRHWVKRVIRGIKPTDVTVVVSSALGRFKLATKGRRRETAIKILTKHAVKAA